MMRVPLRRLIPRPARARAMVAVVRTPYQMAVRRAPPRPGLAMITAGMSSPARTLRVLQVEAGGLHELLEAGDCVYMESEMALAWSAANKHRCRILAVMPAGPRAEG